MQGSIMDSIQRRCCPSLQLLCQIQVIRALHTRAAQMEAEYIDKWCVRELTNVNQKYERNLDIRSGGVNTEKVVKDYQAKIKLIAPPPPPEIPANEPPLKKKNAALKAARAKWLKQQKNSLVHGIPTWVTNQEEYILYRKCKYIEDIKAVRSMLLENLNAATINGLMSTMYNISLYNTKQEHGLLTLQAMLSTRLVTDFRLASAKLYINFSRENGMETSMGISILHFALMEGFRLVNLNLERCGCDSILRLIAQVARNLKYLQISESHVSDQGLLYLCGVQKRIPSTRQNPTRACKEIWNEKAKGVEDRVQKFVKVGDGATGCLELEHLEANNLAAIDWPGVQRLPSYRGYKECQSVPLDSGFVTILTHLRKLRVFLTEISGRVVHSYIRLHRKGRKSCPPLALEVMSESNLTPTLMSSLESVCPRLSELRVNWSDLFHHQTSHREDWIDQMSLVKPSCIRSKEIDFRTDKLANALTHCGENITTMDLRELCIFRYSNFRALKTSCPNLTHLTLAMTTKNIFTSISRIEVDKDANLDFLPLSKNKLTCLKTVHLSGPFGHSVVKYLLKGAESITSLSLGIEWLDPAFCSTQPENRNDFLGKEYLEEILTSCSLSKLEELHLYAQYRRGRHRLTKECAEFVLGRFQSLRHLGNFNFWNLSRPEKNEVISATRSLNREMVFDEDLYTSNTSYSYNDQFEYCYIEDRGSYACNNICLKKDNTGFLSDFFEVLAGPPELFADVESDESETDEDLWSDDDVDNDNLVVNADIEPVCVIM